MILKIRKFTDGILRQPTEPIVDFDHDLQFLIENMIETMRKNKGIGLAAPQVGFSKSVFVCEFEGDETAGLKEFPLTVMCNPKIVEYSERQKNMVEGCLSFPGVELLVRRPESIVIKGQDRYGKEIEVKADGLYARVMQHEFDHLHSTLQIDKIKETRVLFIGTGTLGVKSLELLAADVQYKIVAVVTGSLGKAQTRNKDDLKNPILETAKLLKLPVIETENINDPKVIELLREKKPELGVMADFGQIIKKEILEIPKYGIINIHPSLLPKHRGPSPIQQTILDGDTKGGVSLILTSPKMDAGGVISQCTVPLTHAETSTILKDYYGEIGADLLLNSLPYYLADDLKPIEQKEENVTYTKMIDKNDGFVDENTDPVTVERKVRAFDKWPKVYTIVKGKRIQITASHFDKNNEFVIDRVKPEGKNEMNYSDFINGYKTEIKFKESSN